MSLKLFKKTWNVRRNQYNTLKQSLIFLKWTKSYQKEDHANPKENLTTNEYQCNCHGDLGPEYGFLELSIGSRVEKSRSKQSFQLFVNDCTKDNQKDGRNDWIHKHIYSLQYVSSLWVNFKKFFDVQQSCKNNNEQNGPVERIFVSIPVK